MRFPRRTTGRERCRRTAVLSSASSFAGAEARASHRFVQRPGRRHTRRCDLVSSKWRSWDRSSHVLIVTQLRILDSSSRYPCIPSVIWACPPGGVHRCHSESCGRAVSLAQRQFLIECFTERQTIIARKSCARTVCKQQHLNSAH